jgi:hypothetical protein
MPTHGRTDSPSNYQTHNQQENQDKQPLPAKKRTRGIPEKPVRRVRVRVKRLEQIDEDKIALAYWLLAKAIVENKSAQEVTDEEARRVAQEFDGDPGPASRARGRK